jgi:isoprenylcysteine carboxyl methyltransferase (ICMT) family protein YpbQ
MTNTRCGKIGAAVTGISVVAFAVAMLAGLLFGLATVYISYFICMFIAIGYLMFIAGIIAVSTDKHKTAAGYAGIAFGAVYAIFIFVVYFAGLTTVRMNGALSKEALSIIDYSRLGSLFFNYDLLGYGFMALSTFFVGFTVKPKRGGDRVFRAMLWIHGVFFLSCLIMPMLDVFTADTPAAVGTVILLVWCAYFLPVCILGLKYLDPKGKRD